MNLTVNGYYNKMWAEFYMNSVMQFKGTPLLVKLIDCSPYNNNKIIVEVVESRDKHELGLVRSCDYTDLIDIKGVNDIRFATITQGDRTKTVLAKIYNEDYKTPPKVIITDTVEELQEIDFRSLKKRKIIWTTKKMWNLGRPRVNKSINA